MNSAKENIKSEKQWLRGLFMLLFLVIYEIAEMVLIAVTIAQFLFSILTGKPNSNLTRFGDSLAQFAQQTASYLTCNTDVRPFPFDDWPEPTQKDKDESEVAVASDEAPPTTGS